MSRQSFKLGTRTKKIVLSICVGLLAVYASGFGLIWWAMHQPPEQFGRVMMQMPGSIPFLIYPFETLWLRARAGYLHAGDRVPNFSLLKVDKSDRVQFADLNHNQPVVLIFGSYT